MGPRSLESQEDRSGTIEITTYALTGVFISCFIARQVMKAIVSRKVALDDLFILLAATFAIGLSVTTLILTSKNFGVLDYLSIDRANSIMKTYYASELLYISSLCCSKLSILVLFYNVVALRAHRFLVLGFGMCIFAWSVSSVAAAAFQCELPRPWEMMTLRCFNTRIFWVVYCAIDSASELFIVMLSIDLVVHLKVRTSRKFGVVACFAPRLLVVAAAVVRAVYLYPVSPHENPEYDLWIATVCTQVHVSTSICTACVPFTIPFFKSLQGNIWRSCPTRVWAAKPRKSRAPESLPNRLRKREAEIRFESPQSSIGLIKEPERVSVVSPRIPSPVPISPFLSPPIAAIQLRPGPSTALETRSVKNLGISGIMGDRNPEEMFDVVSLQSAMCFPPSPVVPTQARISSAAIVDVSEPFVYSTSLSSPDPSSSSSCYSSHASTPTRFESTPRFSLFPQTRQHTPSHTALQPDQDLLLSFCQTQMSVASYSETRLLARQTLPNPPLVHGFDDFAHPARSASSRSHPKFSTTPRLHTSATTIAPTNFE